MITVKKVETDTERKDAYNIRMNVFVVEQKVPVEEEIDQFEKEATHFVVYNQNQAIGAGRMRLFDTYGKIERICLLEAARGTGVGRLLMAKIESELKDKGIKKAVLNAQRQAEPFYKKLGYQTISHEFLDAGIPHVTMEKNL